MRADVYLMQYGYVGSRSRAAKLIGEGAVLLDGMPVTKVSETVDETLPHTVTVTDTLPYVGRGGLKLEHALDAFGISCSNRTALDIGASTGGFTDCMLQRGAAHVFAVDAGSGQLSATLREDRRVTNIENCNARYLMAEQLGERFPAKGVSLCVMDVSFISQTLILPRLLPLLCDGADVVTLIKPQFEAGKAQVGKGGLVRSDAARRDAVVRVLDCAQALGLLPVGLTTSPIRGGDGNLEYLLHLKKESREEAVPLKGLLASLGL